MIELNITAGFRISHACKQAIAKANEEKDSVHFDFNGTSVTVQPGESAEQVEKRWRDDFEATAKAYRESPEYKERQEREAKELAAHIAATMLESSQTEAEMYDAMVPTPYTEEQLLEYIGSLVNRSHDYGTCVYAMSMAATAAFNYVAHKLGVSGFQASCADLDVLRRTRSLDGPFMIIKAADALYPQYDLRGKLNEALKEWKPWIKKEAVKKLAETSPVHPDVKAYWESLVQ